MTAKISIKSSMVAALSLGLAAIAAGQSAPQTFKSPEEAVKALEAVAASSDMKKAEAMFGPAGMDLLHSGDEVADKEDARRVAQDISEKVAFEDREGRKVALLGKDRWPFPIPLVSGNGGWHFDIEAGREEIANRRIGRNELSTIASMHAYVDAQKEYLAGKHSGGPQAYAAKVISSKGKHDGLYWPAGKGAPESPLGPLVAAAVKEGYAAGAEPMPFHGYFYRVLTGQGKNAPGGAESYVDEKGAMTKGFALLAWPAKYGTSGIMTFQVDRQGIVFQKDLGPATDKDAGALTAYNPDETWTPTSD